MFELFGYIQNKKPNYVDFFYIQQHIIENQSIDSFLINTFPIDQQDCLILKTLTATNEVIQIEYCKENFLFDKSIIIYGKNCRDITTDNKYNQLVNLGFSHVFIYKGGMFEWCLLQDIYGCDSFPTTSKIHNPLVWNSITPLLT